MSIQQRFVALTLRLEKLAAQERRLSGGARLSDSTVPSFLRARLDSVGSFATGSVVFAQRADLSKDRLNGRDPRSEFDHRQHKFADLEMVVERFRLRCPAW
jgi:hypothetical protein